MARFVPGFLEGIRDHLHEGVAQAEQTYGRKSYGHARKRTNALNLEGIDMADLEQAVRDIVDRRLAERFAELLAEIRGQQPIISAGPSPQAMQAASSGPTYLNECYQCRKPAEAKTNRSTGEKFWYCSDPTCGFTNKEGKFYQSNWNAENWQERHERAQKFANR